MTIQRNTNKKAFGSLNPRAWRPSYDTSEISELIQMQKNEQKAAARMYHKRGTSQMLSGN